MVTTIDDIENRKESLWKKRVKKTYYIKMILDELLDKKKITRKQYNETNKKLNKSRIKNVELHPGLNDKQKFDLISKLDALSVKQGEVNKNE